MDEETDWTSRTKEKGERNRKWMNVKVGKINEVGQETELAESKDSVQYNKHGDYARGEATLCVNNNKALPQLIT